MFDHAQRGFSLYIYIIITFKLKHSELEAIYSKTTHHQKTKINLIECSTEQCQVTPIRRRSSSAKLFANQERPKILR